MNMTRPKLKSIRDRLARHYGDPEPLPRLTPFELVLWESVAYMADDARRLRAFTMLKDRVGSSPEKILAAPAKALRAVTEHGILADQFVEKLRKIARMTRDEFGGDLDEVVGRPLAEARRALRRFPGIGEPGAEKVLLFSRQQPLLAPESNGLRVLVRLGLCEEKKSYAATYAAAREAVAGQMDGDFEGLIAAHRLLRRHGRDLCKRAAPACGACPLRSICVFATALGGAPS